MEPFHEYDMSFLISVKCNTCLPLLLLSMEEVILDTYSACIINIICSLAIINDTQTMTRKAYSTQNREVCTALSVGLASHSIKTRLAQVPLFAICLFSLTALSVGLPSYFIKTELVH